MSILGFDKRKPGRFVPKIRPSAKRARQGDPAEAAKQRKKPHPLPDRESDLVVTPIYSEAFNVDVEEVTDVPKIETAETFLPAMTPVVDKTKVTKLMQAFEDREHKKRESLPKGNEMNKEDLMYMVMQRKNELREYEKEKEKREDEDDEGKGLNREQEATDPRLVEGPAPQVRLVDGRIELDPESLLVSRENWPSSLQETESTDAIKPVASQKRKATSRAWTNAETELFYDALAKHGLHFEKIAGELPDRDAHQVKLKYKREDRTVPWRITECLAKRRD
ncbi:Transcription factor TFIIIB component B [Apophysomyces ossiformis]|uniref:Transcription factor TFIIIB component B n=1 Tax=Apophysomyces ossiformis TaxID=679940 RepID=A0A8H7BJV6_9FUNG|nr:Transcription factor TFIIIB component B [Apophysomyces ossiformis]